MNKSVKIFGVFGLLLAVTGCSSTRVSNKEKDYELTIVHVNDVHGRAKEGKYDGVGYGRVATIAKNLEMDKKNGKVIMMDGGDTIHGTTFATLNKGESMIEVLNGAGLDYMALGNHDFNYGEKRLKELLPKAEFTVLGSNVVDKNTGKVIGKEYDIQEIDGVKVGFFGLSTPETYYKTNPKNIENIRFIDPIVAAKSIVKKLQKEKVKFIVVVAHLGEDSSTEKKYQSIGVAEAVPEINIIIDGHSHTPLSEKKVVNGVTIVQTGEYSKNVGVVKVDFDMLKKGSLAIDYRLMSKQEILGEESVNKATFKKKVKELTLKDYTIKPGDTLLKVSREYSVSLDEILKYNKNIKNPNNIEIGNVYKIPVMEEVTKTVIEGTTVRKNGIPEDPKVKEIIERIDKDQRAITEVKVGKSEFKLEGDRSVVRTGESNLAQLITDAMIWKTEADIAITNGGGIRASINEGNITVGDIISVLPFGNYVITKELTGQQIKDALEHGLRAYPESLGGLCQIAGLEVKFNPKNTEGKKVVSIKKDGRDLDLNRTYLVATNDFMAAGGDGYSSLKAGKEIGHFPGLDEVLIEYIKENGISSNRKTVEKRIIPVK
ncbi:MAG: 5'-nucleotidase C-terminal domain-containing protein [Cetobacterium sp.]|nr:5'-nucleotidase C-terminal domain-containing protein [Cetobacterium sp.]